MTSKLYSFQVGAHGSNHPLVECGYCGKSFGWLFAKKGEAGTFFAACAACRKVQNDN